MTRQVFIFLASFVTSAVIALVVRAALFQPHAGHEGHPAPGGDYAPMVSNPLTPAQAEPANPPEAKTAARETHAGHGTPAPQTADAGKPVNTVCAICGMDVNPNLPTLQYQGKTIGFGCKMCPPKFKADPDRYGPFYLRDEVIKK